MPELAGRHSSRRRPETCVIQPDVGYQGDTSPGPEMPNAHLEVLPQGTAGHSVEGTDDKDDP
jgi:hypothetical protein